MKKTVFLFIPHFVFSSDLLRTDFIKLLSEKFKVVVFSPIFLNNLSASYYKNSDIEYVYYDAERPSFWLFFTRTLRISMIREFDDLEYFKLRQLTKANLNWQRKLLRKISWFIPKRFLTADFFTKLEELFSLKSSKFFDYVKKYSPELILTCTPGFSAMEAEIIVLSKKINIKTVAINSSWDNYISNATQFRKTDYLFCWNPVMKREAIKIHKYEPENVFVSGIYRFDHHFKDNSKDISKEDFLIKKGLDPKLKTILLCTLPPNTYPPQYGIWKRIVEMRNEGKFSQDVNIFFRLHPNDFIEKYKYFIGIKNVHIDLAGKPMSRLAGSGHKIEMDDSDLDNLRYSLKYTDVNLNFRSSLTLEAAIYKKPIINLALEGYANRYNVDWYKPIVKDIKFVESEKELINAINFCLKNENSDSFDYSDIIKNYVGFLDGGSSKRSVCFVDDIVKKNREKNR